MTDSERLLRLDRPKGVVDVVLDTDAYNEIDDQFALAYLLRAPDRARIKAIYAAPFHNERSSGPEDGMEKSHREILTLLRLAGEDRLLPSVFKGARGYMADEKSPAPSAAVDDLVARAMRYTPENPLYVVAIGAITNIASALVLHPEIRERIVLVWLGGHALEWEHTREFNMQQDVAAARVVFGCGVPLVQLPCMGVVSAFTTTGPELAHWLRGRNALCDYLVDNTVREAETYAKGKPWSRPIWDVTAVAWVLDRACALVADRLIHSPIPQYDHHYSHDPRRHLIRYVYHVYRDRLFEDLFTRLAR